MTSTVAVFKFTPAFSHSPDLVPGLVVQTKMLQERDRNTPTRVVHALLDTHYNVKRSNLSLVYESHAMLCESALSDSARIMNPNLGVGMRVSPAHCW